MSICETCPIEEKLYQCCGRNPMTGEKRPLRLDDGTVVLACPYLDSRGMCRAYDSRPQGCAVFVCDEYRRRENIPSPGFFSSGFGM